MVMIDCPHCRRANERADRLEEELTQLRAAAQPKGLFDMNDATVLNAWRVAFRLTPSEALFLSAITASPERTLTYGYLLEATARDIEVEPKLTQVVVCKLRKVLKAVDPLLTIETVWGSGYIMRCSVAAAVRARVEAVLR